MISKALRLGDCSPLTHMKLHNHYSQEEHFTIKLHSGRREGPDRNWLVCWVAKYQFVSNCTFRMNKDYVCHYFLKERAYAHVWGIPSFKSKGRGSQCLCYAVSNWKHAQLSSDVSRKQEKRRKRQGLYPSFSSNSHTFPDLWAGTFLLLHEWMHLGRATVSTSRQAG